MRTEGERRRRPDVWTQKKKKKTQKKKTRPKKKKSKKKNHQKHPPLAQKKKQTLTQKKKKKKTAQVPGKKSYGCHPYRKRKNLQRYRKRKRDTFFGKAKGGGERGKKGVIPRGQEKILLEKTPPDGKGTRLAGRGRKAKKTKRNLLSARQEKREKDFAPKPGGKAIYPHKRSGLRPKQKKPPTSPESTSLRKWVWTPPSQRREGREEGKECAH